MIIGINGRIGSGKDTFGMMVQALTMPKGGRWQANPVEYVQSYKIPNLKGGWAIKKYAAKLKQIASILTGIPVEKFEDQEFKKSFLGPEWDYWVYKVPGSVEESPRFCSEAELHQFMLKGCGRGHEPFVTRVRMTVRQFLQELGTDGVRNGVHPAAWINALFAEYQEEEYTIPGVSTFMPLTRYPDWVITDMRFPDEADAIGARGGVTVRIKRELPDVEYPTLESLHKSETSLDDYDFSYEISNNGSLEELLEKVKVVMSDVQEKARLIG